MKHLDLFSGIGGFALACQWLGIETIGFVEIDKYCQKVLRKHWLNVPIVEEIRNVKEIKRIVTNATRERLSRTGIEPQYQSEVGQFSNANSEIRQGGIRGRPESPTLLITAGFPCQPFSVAGKQRGKEDDRYLWPETLAVIKTIKPRWVLLENVTGIINLALGQVLSDMESAGYSTETLIIPACAVNAWHRRDRVWIIANCNGNRKRQRHSSNSFSKKFTEVCQRRSCKDKENKGTDFNNGSQDVANANIKGLAKWEEQIMLEQCSTAKRDNQSIADPDSEGEQQQEGYITKGGEWDSYESWNSNWIEVATCFCRVAYGISNRMDRLKCLGNAIVPQIAYELIKVIKEVDSTL